MSKTPTEKVNEIREKVAAAIFAVAYGAPGEREWSRASAFHREQSLRRADAAIDAIKDYVERDPDVEKPDA